MTARSHRRIFALTLAALLAVLLAVGLLSVAPSARAEVKPRNDYTRLPSRCLAPGEIIPGKPVVCRLNTYVKGNPTVLLWGDSHAWMMVPGLKVAARNRNVNLVAVVMGGCPPMNNLVKPNSSAPGCYRSNAVALRFIASTKEKGEQIRVLLGASWGRYREALRTGDTSYTGQMARAMKRATPRLMKTLSNRRVKTDVIGQVATVPARHKACAAGERPFQCSIVRRKALPDELGTRNWLKRTMKPLSGDRPPINLNTFCDAERCHGRVGDLYTWWDDLHLSATMARRLHSLLQPTVDKVAPPIGPDDGGTPPPSCTVPLLCR